MSKQTIKECTGTFLSFVVASVESKLIGQELLFESRFLAMLNRARDAT